MTTARPGSHEDCIAFLKWYLPRVGLHWPGYRRVHRLVCKRLNRRMAELGMAQLAQYEPWLAEHPDELARIDVMCRIPISRFYRDRDVFQAIGATVLPAAAEAATRSGAGSVRCWSAGCASGEEPFTMLLVWHFQVARDWPQLGLRLLATDADDVAISRARAACYAPSSLKDLPRAWVDQAFRRANGLCCLNCTFRNQVEFVTQDITQGMPDGIFDIILCRNLVFTYFDETQRLRMLSGLVDRLTPRGFLVLGKHEALPPRSNGLARLSPSLPIYQRSPRERSVSRLAFP